MKKILILVGAISISYMYAQHNPELEGRIGINTDKPKASLDIRRHTEIPAESPQGMILPHLSTEQRNTFEKSKLERGLMIYNTTKNCIDWWNGIKWQCMDGSNADLHTTATPPTQGKAQVWDRTHYIASFTHNGANINGEINNTDKKLIIEIPYNEAIGSYNEITVLSANVMGREGSRDLILKIPAGNFATNKGYLNAEIIVGNGTTDTYKVKHLAPNTEETIATFSFSINGRTSTVKIIASGGVLDKKFNTQTGNQYLHKFIYVPVSVYKGTIANTGMPYEKIWLNNNLGAEYSDTNNPRGNFNPTQDPKTFDDFRAYGSLFRWGRDSDGHELINWTSSTSGTWAYPSAGYTGNLFYTKENDPCPTGWTMPTSAEGDMLSTTKSIMNIPASGRRNDYSGNTFYEQGKYGYIWTTTPSSDDSTRAISIEFSSNKTAIKLNGTPRLRSLGVRCIQE